MEGEIRNRVKIELQELENKLNKLIEFISSEKFEELSKRQQELLIEQRFCMSLYAMILKNRLIVWE